MEEKRTLLNTMFSNLYLFDGEMRYEINPAFTVMRDKVFQTNEMLLESSEIVKITDINPEKPELGKNVDVLDEVEYVTLTNSVIRDIHVWNLK